MHKREKFTKHAQKFIIVKKIVEEK